MKSKQLANVLIRILGLSMFINYIPSLFSALIPLLQSNGVANINRGDYFWLYPLTVVVSIAIGIYLIVKSKEVTAFLFKDETD